MRKKYIIYQRVEKVDMRLDGNAAGRRKKIRFQVYRQSDIINKINETGCYMEQDLWQYLKKAEKPIVLYGMGNGADKVISALDYFGIKYSGVFATDSFIKNKSFHGFKLSSYGALKEKFGKMIVLLCFGSGRPEVLENIRRISAEQELYAPDVPVCGGGLFTAEYLKEHEKELQYVYSRLADEKSRETLSCIINYKISGKPEYLYRCEASAEEPYQSFLRLNNNESFLDIGAYNGDTVSDFLCRVSGYESITAAEPDIKSFKKLSVRVSGLKRTKILNACVTDRCGSELFYARGGRGSAAGNGKEIPSVTVDSITEGGKATFIKMDIEGGELRAIKGARRTIRRQTPKLLVACYHRVGDLFELPLAVDKIKSGYKLYLRHFPCVPAWDTDYYFIP